MTRKGPTGVEWLTPDLARDFGVTWTTLQPPRAIPVPPQPNLRPGLRPPPQIIAAWSRATTLATQQQSAIATPPRLPSSFQDDASCRALGAPGSAAYVTCRQHFEKQVAKPPAAQLVPPSADPPGIARPAPKAIDRFAPGQNASPFQKVVLFEEDTATDGQRFEGSVRWRTETLAAPLGRPPELGLVADIEVPERKLRLTFTFRRNANKGLAADHTIEVLFKLTPDFPAGGISNVPGILIKRAQSTRGVPLAGLGVKVTPTLYLIGLSNQEADKDRNLQLLKERGWIEIPIVYSNNRRAVLAIEEGLAGDRAFADVLGAWEQPIPIRDVGDSFSQYTIPLAGPSLAILPQRWKIRRTSDPREARPLYLNWRRRSPGCLQTGIFPLP